MLGLAARPGSFDWRRIIATLKLLAFFCTQLLNSGAVYMLIASSKLGFLRDALMIWASRLLGRRLVLHLHGGGYRPFYETQPPWLQRVIAKTVAQADAIIVLGEQLRDQFAFVPNIEEKIHVVPNGLPLDLQPKTVRSKSLPTTGALRLLYLSNLIESKGYLTLLEACRILHHEHQIPIHCDFCGDFGQTSVDKLSHPSEAKANFLHLISTWQLTDVVTYHGMVTGDKKQQFLEQAHTLILPTTYPWEGQPISIIEALAFSTPVIATSHRGIPEQVIDRYNGFLVAPNAINIAEALLEMLQNPTLYQALSKNAKTHFEEHFTQEKYLKLLIPLILGKSSL
jgi:glycosyltransferase involved in cell wall biosynthesis